MSEPEPTISEPLECTQALHIGQDMNWQFDESVDLDTVLEEQKPIGKGGFGSVITLKHLPSGVIFAGKMINPDVLGRASLQSLKKEIELMKQIRTPYTVPYYGSVDYKDHLMILMGFCEKGSIRDIMDSRQEPLTEAQASIVLHDLLIGIQILHVKYNIIHRDIKAANILLSNDGKLRIADFGVSRQFDVAKTAATMSIVGTPYWMAPEVINGEKYSYPADVWSIGSTAIELVEGAPLYSEYPVMRAMVEIATHGFSGFREGHNFSPEFTEFVKKCLVQEPSMRATIPELLQDPFITKYQDQDRQAIFKDILNSETNFDLLLAGDEEDEDDTKSHRYKSFVTQAQQQTNTANEDNSVPPPPAEKPAPPPEEEGEKEDLSKEEEIKAKINEKVAQVKNVVENATRDERFIKMIYIVLILMVGIFIGAVGVKKSILFFMIVAALVAAYLYYFNPEKLKTQ